MNTTTIVGIVATICTGVWMVPQLTKLIKEKKADGISVFMLLVLFIGVGCWVAYGILKKDWIIIISNSFSFIVNMVLTILTIRFKKKAGN